MEDIQAKLKKRLDDLEVMAAVQRKSSAAQNEEVSVDQQQNAILL